MEKAPEISVRRSGLGSSFSNLLGPSLNSTEACLICWGLFLAFLVLPIGVTVGRRIQGGQLARTFSEVDFVYVYSLGRIFDQYPAAQVYDYKLQEKVLMECLRWRNAGMAPWYMRRSWEFSCGYLRVCLSLALTCSG